MALDNDLTARLHDGWTGSPHALAQSFFADLEADYRLNAAETIALLRLERPVSYFRLMLTLCRAFGVAEPAQPGANANNPPPSADQPNQPAAEPTDPRNDPYRVVKRSIARERLRDTILKAEQELARLAAEEETETRAAEEEIDARLAARRAEREAAAASARAVADRATAPTTETTT